MSESRSARAKTWQLVLFSFNDSATNMIMMLMAFVSYLYTGAIGTSVIFISTFLTGMRVWDAVTDPIIGWIIDHTGGRFGKFRPMICIGYFLMLLSLLQMFFGAPRASENAKFVLFVASYVVYVIGYTFQTACTKAGQTCMTIDQDQRPIISRASSIVNMGVFTGVPMYTSMYLAPKYGGFTVAAMQEFCITALLISGVLTVCAVTALWTRDVPENWGVDKKQNIKVKDCLDIVVHNHPLQLLIASAASDKIATLVSTNSSVLIMLFGIIMGDYALNGSISMITIIPNIIFIILGTQLAKKQGFRKIMSVFSLLDIILYALLGVMVMTVQPGTISLQSMNFATIAFLVLYCLSSGTKNVSCNMAVPMIADCTDYEVVRSGHYAPGIIGTIFSFVDKVISSLSTTIVGLFMVAIGYSNTLPQPTDALTPGVRTSTLLCFVILPIIGWMINIISMKFYKLDEKTMEKIHDRLVEIKAKNE